MADESKPAPVALTLEDTEAVARFAKALDELAKADGHYLDGKIRVWNPHGWSPGYFQFEDEWVNFYADYQESGR